MGNIREEDRPRLPNGLTYNKACADYLREFNKVWKKRALSLFKRGGGGGCLIERAQIEENIKHHNLSIYNY